MLSALKDAWDFLRAPRIATRPVACATGYEGLEVRVYRKRDGTCWVTVVTTCSGSRIYVPFRPDQMRALIGTLQEPTDTALHDAERRSR